MESWRSKGVGLSVEFRGKGGKGARVDGRLLRGVERRCRGLQSHVGWGPGVQQLVFRNPHSCAPPCRPRCGRGWCTHAGRCSQTCEVSIVRWAKTK